MARENHTTDAEKMFQRFAARHGLTFEVDQNAPIEVCWRFPEQANLSLPITLGLQNCDELNFGVSDFWSYFFPYSKVEREFENILDAWIVGDARVAVTHGRGRFLQVRSGEDWQTVYGASGCLLPWSRKPTCYLTNR